jgi:hypothetical protein
MLKCVLRRISITACFLVFLILGGCAQKSEISQFYNPLEPALVQKPINPNLVEVAEPTTRKQINDIMKHKPGQQAYRVLGFAQFSGPLVSLPELRKFAASVGGDYVLRTADFAGIQDGTRMVVGSYTPGSISYSTGNAFGASSASSYTSGSTPLGAFTSTTYGSGSAYGTATATTYNPGQTTYVRENFKYPVFIQAISIMQSPTTQNRNWKNMQTFLRLDKNGFDLDLSRVSTEQQVKSAPPSVQELLKQMKAGRKFTPIEAQQFIHHYIFSQNMRENFKEPKAN